MLSMFIFKFLVISPMVIMYVQVWDVPDGDLDICDDDVHGDYDDFIYLVLVFIPWYTVASYIPLWNYVMLNLHFLTLSLSYLSLLVCPIMISTIHSIPIFSSRFHFQLYFYFQFFSIILQRKSNWRTEETSRNGPRVLPPSALLDDVTIRSCAC